MSCAKPTEPELLNSNSNNGGYLVVEKFATSGYAQDILKKDNLVYISQGEGGLLIVDMSNPKDPIVVSTTTKDVRGYSTKIAMKDSIVYLAAGSFGVTVINAGNTSMPVVTLSNSAIKPARNLHILGDFLFTAISEQGVKIAKITDVISLDPRGNINTMGYANGLCTSLDSNLLLVACGEMGLQIFNISNLNNGYGPFPSVGYCDTKGYAEDVKVSDINSIAFMSCGTAGLQIINFSDPANIFITGSYNTGGYAKELIYENQIIYITTEKRGLQIINVSDVSNPSLIGTVDTEFALGIDMDENYIYIADENEGLIIIAKPK